MSGFASLYPTYPSTRPTPLPDLPLYPTYPSTRPTPIPESQRNVSARVGHLPRSIAGIVALTVVGALVGTLARAGHRARVSGEGHGAGVWHAGRDA